MKKLTWIFALAFTLFSSGAALAEVDIRSKFASLGNAVQVDVQDGELRFMALLPTSFFQSFFEEKYDDESPVMQMAAGLFFNELDQYAIFLIGVEGIGAMPLSDFTMRVDDGKWQTALDKGALPGMLQKMMEDEDRSARVRFVAFRNTDSAGEKLFSPEEKKNVTLKIGEKSHTWNLPFTKQPVHKKRNAPAEVIFPPDFRYNPYTGEKLK